MWAVKCVTNGLYLSAYEDMVLSITQNKSRAAEFQDFHKAFRMADALGMLYPTFEWTAVTKMAVN